MTKALHGGERTMNENEEFVIHVDDVPWTAGKTGLMRKSLVELANGPKARVVRIQPGEIVPRHKHPSNEIMYVLDGELQMHGKVYGPGTCYYKPKDWFYGPLSTKTGVSVLLFFDGPDAVQI
jgi:anti-sigma factor ChrR (cupin superfamily)